MSRKNELAFYEDPFFDDFFAPSFRRNEVTMKTDIKDNDNNYEFNVELPGVKKENINVDLEDGYLTISYHEEHNDDEKRHGKYIRKERYYGNMSRSFYVGDIDKDKIEASYENGVLKIFVPKELEAKKETKKIEIK